MRSWLAFTSVAQLRPLMEIKIGARLSGSKLGSAAAEKAAVTLAKLGYDVELCHLPRWKRQECNAFDE